jgi:hypothetical protein
MQEESKKYDLDELLRKSPMDVTHDEMMFILENMDLASLIKASANKQNEAFIESIKPTDEQNN